jgi:hypothetical protein
MAVTRGRSHGPRRGAAVEREASQGREQSGALRTNPDSMDQLLISERAHPLWPSLGAGGGGTTVGREASQRREWGHGHTFPYPKAPEMFFFCFSRRGWNHRKHSSTTDTWTAETISRRGWNHRKHSSTTDTWTAETILHHRSDRR